MFYAIFSCLLGVISILLVLFSIIIYREKQKVKAVTEYRDKLRIEIKRYEMWGDVEATTGDGTDISI